MRHHQGDNAAVYTGRVLDKRIHSGAELSRRTRIPRACDGGRPITNR